MNSTTTARVQVVAAQWEAGLVELSQRYPNWIAQVRQTGLVIGLRMHQEMGGMMMTRLLFDHGVWAMFAGFDRSVLQLKPGLLIDDATTVEALDGLDRACAVAASW